MTILSLYICHNGVATIDHQISSSSSSSLSPVSLSTIDTDICLLNLCQLIATSLACSMLLTFGIYLLYRLRMRHYRTLLTLHNLRSSIELLLLAINTIELARACLQFEQKHKLKEESFEENDFVIYKNLTFVSSQINQIFIIIPPYLVGNAIAAIALTIILLIYHRIVEIKNVSGCLYLSAVIQTFIATFRIYQIALISYDHEFIDLESFLQYMSAMFLIILTAIDGYAIYKERFKTKKEAKKSSTKEKKIGYKHSVATFTSKILFWWLTPLLWRGFHQPLELEDLGYLREEDSARAHYDQFLLIYKTASGKTKNPSLWLCYIKSSWKTFTLGGLLKLFGDLSALVGPLSIHQIVGYIEKLYENVTPIQQMQQQQFEHNIHQQMANNYSSITSPMGLNFNLSNYVAKTITSSPRTIPIQTPIVIIGNNVEDNVNFLYPNWTDLLSNGWIIAWIVLLASIAQGGLSQASTHLLNMTGIRIKTSLQGLIYRKTLLLNSCYFDNSDNNNDNYRYANSNNRNNRKTSTMSNQKKSTSSSSSSSSSPSSSNNNKMQSVIKDTASITNLMSEDALNVMSFFWIAHYVWAIPLKIGVVMYLLYLQLGISAIIGSFVCILTMTPLQFLIGKAMSNNAEIAAKCTDERLKKTNDIFMGIKLIKLNAWENVFSEKIRQARNKELKYLNKDSFYWTIMTFLTHVSSVLITFVTLAVYVKLNGDSFGITNSILNSFARGDNNTNTNIMGNGTFATTASTSRPVTGPATATTTTSMPLSTIMMMMMFQLGNHNFSKDNMSTTTSNSTIPFTSIPLPKIIAKNFTSQFTASRLFSSLALFNQLTVPLLIFPITVPIIISAIVSTRRLERFLLETEVQKEREGIRNMARILSKSDASLDMYENIDEDETTTTAGSNIFGTFSEISSIAADNNAIAALDSLQNIPTSITITTTTTSPPTPTQSQPPTPPPEPTSQSNQINPIMALTSNVSNNSSLNVNEIKSNEIDDAKALKNGNSSMIGGDNVITNAAAATICIDDSYNSSSTPKRRRDNLIRNSRIERARSKQVRLASATPSPRESIHMQTLDNVAVYAKNVVFSWDNCNTLLKIDDLQIPKGKLTIVVGKNGSGKSSLLAGLLHEMQQISGELVWNKYSTIAYVSQLPWLLNSSIRENILFGESFRPKRYDKVLNTCALKPDIELMPEGDMTIIGERGINLSGGQKQRIAIARSLYSSANVVIMDDPLSSLDNEVAKHVFENSIKKMLLKANRTAILVTQNLQLISHADFIVVMKDGYVQTTGTYHDIELKHPNIVTEWTSIIANRNKKNQMSPGKTAQERWKLFKNITKIGLQSKNNSEENVELTQPSFTPLKRRSSLFSSRYLFYDFPLPIDECHDDDIIVSRRPSRRSLNRMSAGGYSGEKRASCRDDSERKNNILRVHSLQPRSMNRIEERKPVGRITSTPGCFLEMSDDAVVKRGLGTKNSFRQFLNRMSSRRNNRTTSVRANRQLSETSSIMSISEEQQSSLNRTESINSEWDDDSVQDLSSTNEDHSASALVYDEERKYGEIPTKIYLLYLKASGWPLIIIFCITALIYQCVRVLTDVWLQNWTTTIKFFETHEVTYYFHIYAIISAICILMALVSTPAGQLAGCRARRILHDKLLNAILGRTLHFFQTTPLGRIINRFSNDMAIIDKKIAATSQRLLQFTLLCLCAVLINVSVTPWFIILTVPICAAYYIIQKFYRCSSRELQRLENITNSPVISHFAETIMGVTTIRAFNQEARFTETLFKRLEANTIAFTILNTSNRWLGIALDCLGGVIVYVGIMTALIAATITSRQNHEIAKHSQTPTQSTSALPSPSPSLVGLAINYTLLVPIYLNWVVKLLADMEMYVGSVERFAFYTTQSSSTNKTNPATISTTNSNTSTNNSTKSKTNFNIIQKVNCNETATVVDSNEALSTTNKAVCKFYKSVPISWPQKGDITFDNISLRYQNQKKNVITDFSLVIPAGQKIGICGRTGSGKSTLALSLFGVVDVTSGRILIDDVDITQIHPDEIRSRLSIIPQDVHLFNATIRENLDPRGYYSDLELWNCLELAQLKDIVNSMSLGLDTEIVEGGGNLSAGHRQLFCLARAVLRGSVCLVLDEATSSLDATIETALMDAAHNAFQGRTILTIAHRLSTILNYDRIIVLENGKIIEDGSPKELQMQRNGKFQSMLKSAQS